VARSAKSPESSMRARAGVRYPTFKITVDRTESGPERSHRTGGRQQTCSIPEPRQLQITRCSFGTYDNGVNLQPRRTAAAIQHSIDSGHRKDICATSPQRKDPDILYDWASISDQARCRLSRTTTSVGSVDVYASVQERDLGAVARDASGLSIGTASCCRAAAS